MLPLKVNLKQAILWLRAAWNKITVSTMVNFWCKADILPEEWNHRLRPDRAAVVVAEAAEEAQMTAIASAIENLPVEDGTARLSAAEWVLAPGEMETIAEIAARLLGQGTAEEDDGEPDSNYVEPLPVTLEEAKRSSLCLSEFLEDNIALFSEEGY
ncbi:hypothetical protein EMCRGX_G030388 [Ephydatia muelleri]